MTELNNDPCSCDHVEYSDPLEIATSAGAWLSTGHQAHNCKNKWSIALVPWVSPKSLQILLVLIYT